MGYSYNPNIPHLYVGYNPFTNHLLTSWDIQVSQWVNLEALGQWIILVIGGRDYITPQKGKDYTWYISGIYCQLGDYIYYLPPFSRIWIIHWLGDYTVVTGSMAFATPLPRILAIQKTPW